MDGVEAVPPVSQYGIQPVNSVEAVPSESICTQKDGVKAIPLGGIKRNAIRYNGIEKLFKSI